MNNPNHPAGLDQVVHALKAAADPTRARLLALLSHGELAVHEICEILDQSQPRVSRHLRLLVEAGFLVRFREQKLVYYRLPVDGRGRAWWEVLRQLLRAGDPQLEDDRRQMLSVVAARAMNARKELHTMNPERGLAEGLEDLEALLLEELGPVGVGSLLDVGTGTGRMIEILGRRAKHAVGVDISPSALKVARTRVHGAGLAHVEFRQGDMYRLPGPDASFDLVSLERLLGQAERPAKALAEAARMLKPGGRLLVIEHYEDIGAQGANPLLQLQEWISAAGLVVRRLHPCDLRGGHYLIALAGHADGVERAA